MLQFVDKCIEDIGLRTHASGTESNVHAIDELRRTIVSGITLNDMWKYASYPIVEVMVALLQSPDTMPMKIEVMLRSVAGVEIRRHWRESPDAVLAAAMKLFECRLADAPRAVVSAFAGGLATMAKSASLPASVYGLLVEPEEVDGAFNKFASERPDTSDDAPRPGASRLGRMVSNLAGILPLLASLGAVNRLPTTLHHGALRRIAMEYLSRASTLCAAAEIRNRPLFNQCMQVWRDRLCVIERQVEVNLETQQQDELRRRELVVDEWRALRTRTLKLCG